MNQSFGLKSVASSSFGFGHLPRDVSLLSLGVGYHARCPFVRPPQPLPFALGSRAFAFVRESLPFVCCLLTKVRDPITLISDLVALAGVVLAFFQRSVTLLEGLLALVEFGCAAIEFTEGFGAVLSDHNSR